ncbi:FUSC family protein [Micromonospora sp. WMMD1082]|uniref:FUSC family protein n=1 Tax=Micromonospora sp. WMMD1082 TaxID=3016104 RepID=UPI002415C0F4|nr:FUSC family protein [Micromonospora sp. WMMD1082]MDG4796811.1 FUSC family protein [Micromonospora sp. WMMD1082]
MADRSDAVCPCSSAEAAAREITMRVRRHGGEMGRLRLRQLEIILVIAGQAGVAAALSWAVAHNLLDRPFPIFAPSAAVGIIVAALGQRARRTVELMLGVALGLVVGNLLLLVLGFGAWQLGVVVALAITVALLLTGRSGALVAQAGSAAVLIATLSPGEPDLEWSRLLDAAVGGVVGLVVVGLLLPVNPMRVIDRAATPIITTLHEQLQEIAHAMTERDAGRAVRALDRLRAVDADVDRLHESLQGAEEVALIAPRHWRRRHDVERYLRGVQHFDRVMIECRGLARWTATSLQNGERLPAELPVAVRRLAEALRLLRQESRTGRPPTKALRLALATAEAAGRARVHPLERYADGVVTRLFTAVSDLIRSIGYEPDRANRMTRAAAQRATRDA